MTFYRQAIITGVLVSSLAGIGAAPAFAASLDASNLNATDTAVLSGQYRVRTVSVEKDRTGFTRSFTDSIQLAAGYSFDETSDGGLRFVDTIGQEVAKWGSTLNLGSVTVTGKFIKVDNEHFRYTADTVKTSDRRVGFRDWFKCTTKYQVGAAAGGAVTGCLGTAVAGCAPGAIVGGAAGWVGGTVGGALTCLF